MAVFLPDCKKIQSPCWSPVPCKVVSRRSSACESCWRGRRARWSWGRLHCRELLERGCFQRGTPVQPTKKMSEKEKMSDKKMSDKIKVGKVSKEEAPPNLPSGCVVSQLILADSNEGSCTERLWYLGSQKLPWWRMFGDFVGKNHLLCCPQDELGGISHLRPNPWEKFFFQS